MYCEKKIEMSLAEFQRKSKQNFSGNRGYMLGFNERELKFVIDENKHTVKLFFKPTFVEYLTLAGELYCVFDNVEGAANELYLNYRVRKSVRSYVYYTLENVMGLAVALIVIGGSEFHAYAKVLPAMFAVAFILNLYSLRKRKSGTEERLLEIFEEFLDDMNP